MRLRNFNISCGFNFGVMPKMIEYTYKKFIDDCPYIDQIHVRLFYNVVYCILEKHKEKLGDKI